MWSAISFNLDQSKTLSSVYEFSKMYPWSQMLTLCINFFPFPQCLAHRRLAFRVFR